MTSIFFNIVYFKKSFSRIFLFLLIIAKLKAMKILSIQFVVSYIYDCSTSCLENNKLKEKSSVFDM